MDHSKLKISYINDQIFPNRETDSEQMMQTVSNMGKADCDITFIIPLRWFSGKTTEDVIADYYQVDKTFSISLKRSFYPSFRWLEKIAHGVVSVFSKEVKNSDVIYTRSLPTVIPALLFTKKPVFYETFRNWPDQMPFMKHLFNRLKEFNNFSGLVLHSQFAADSYLNIGYDPQKVIAKRNGYDPKRIQPVLTKDEAREKLDLPKNRKILTYAGHVSPEKGLLGVLDLADANKDAYFVIAGSKERTEVEERAENMENVKIVPWLKFDKVVEYLYAADILLIPPTVGPLKTVGNTVLPIKTFLYMACNRVIFAPDSPDFKGVLMDNVNAKLVEPDNFEEADKGLKELLNNPELCEKLSQQAYQDTKELTYEKRSADIVEFIRERV